MSESDAVTRLTELLDAKDAEIERLGEELALAKERIEFFEYKSWWMPKDIGDDDQELPVPRLQIECEAPEPSFSQLWTYSLIYRHTMGHLTKIVLGATRRSCGGRCAPTLDDLPYRGGTHIRRDSAQLNLPAFAVVGRESLRLEPMEKRV